MRERPILFSGEMVRAILDGRKTQTRRIVKGIPSSARHDAAFTTNGVPHTFGFAWGDAGAPIFRDLACPYGVPGDRLWVRERTRVVAVEDGTQYAGSIEGGPYRRIKVRYEADSAESGWVPYPPRLVYVEVGNCIANGCYAEASRITLELTAVRVERVQDISEEDAIAEGCKEDRYRSGREPGTVETARLAYERLWQRINGPDSWAANPYVWVLSFKRIEEAGK